MTLPTLKKYKELCAGASLSDGTISSVRDEDGEVESWHTHTEEDGEIIGDYPFNGEADARFDAEARTGWPRTILALEKTLERLEQFQNYFEGIAYLDGMESVDQCKTEIQNILEGKKE